MCEGERLNFYRLSLLIMDGGTPTLKWLFEKQYAASGDLEMFLKSRTTVLDGLHQRKIINLKQMDLLRPSTGIKPSVEKFDTSLLITLLTNICPIQQPHGGWTVSPAASDLCTGADILRVRDARNNLFHHAKCGVSDAEFQLESSNVSAAISRLSSQLDQQQQVNIQKIINDARHADRDFGREKEICNLIFLDKIDEIHHLVQGIYDRGLAASEASRSLMKDEKHDGTKDQPNIDMRFTHGENSVIIVVKLYADLKKELTREIVMSIAKVLFKEENRTAVLEELERASSRELCIDSLFKRVIHREAATVQSFLMEIKSKCPVMANLLAKTIITEEDCKKFQLIDDRVQKRGRICSRVRTQSRIDEADVEFFQLRLYYSPEIVDKIADVLLSKFYMSFSDHSKVTLQSDVFARIRCLFKTIQFCLLDSVSELESVLGSKLYKEWIEFRNETSGPNGENTGIWQSIIQRISGAAASLMESICQTFHIDFIRSERGSLVLIFKAGDNFSIELLKPESVKKKVRELLEKTCPEHHPLFKHPIHVTIFIKSAKYGDKEEIHFFLETIKDRKEIEDVHSHFGRHERDYMIEEMDPTPLKQWMFERLKIDECTKVHLEDIISWNDIGRGEKMKILIDTLERFEDGYELLQRYCEENDKFVYGKVFKKGRRQSRTDHKTEFGYDKGEGMQMLFSTWIDFREDPTGSHKASEVLVSDERKWPGIEELAIQIAQGNVDNGQSSVETEIPPSRNSPEDSEDEKQENHTDSEVPISNEGKELVIEGTTAQIGHEIVDNGQSSVDTERPSSGPIPDNSEDDTQENHTDSEVPISNEGKELVIEGTTAQIGHEIVDNGQSSVDTERPSSGPSPENSEDDTQGNHRDLEVPISDEGKQPVIEVTSTQIGQEIPIKQSVEEELNQAGIKMSTEERDLFIKFQNEIGTDIYFSKGTHRLVDGQEALKATETFLEQNRPDMKDKWLEYKSQGKLTPELIDVIYAEERNQELHENKDYFLNTMEQLNIIVKARAFNENGVKEENYYFTPWMLHKESPREVIAPETDARMVSTSVLCWVIKGTSMLLEIFQKLIAACLARWPVAKKKNTSESLIFQNCTVFDLDPVHRLFLHCENHAVFARITRMGIDHVNAKMCTRVRKFITLNLSHQDPNLKYQLCVQTIESQDLPENIGSCFSPPFEMWFVDEEHDPAAPITREHMNHARLCVAIVSICGNAMKTILQANPPAPHTSIFQAILASKTKLISRTQNRSGKWQKALLNKDQCKIIFPDPKRQYVASIDQFDISLLYTLIRNISSVKPPSTAWGVAPQDWPRDKSLGANVERIHLYRNEICGHSVDGQISKQEFDDYWKKIDLVLRDIDVIVGQAFSQELEMQRRQVISVYEAC